MNTPANIFSVLHLETIDIPLSVEEQGVHGSDLPSPRQRGHHCRHHGHHGPLQPCANRSSSNQNVAQVSPDKTVTCLKEKN